MKFIEDYSHQFGVEKMCRALEVSRSGYYAWRGRKPSSIKLENSQIIDEIRRIHADSKYRYGSPKITKELHSLGWQVSRPRVARMMNSLGLRSIICKKFRGATTDSKHNLPVAANHLNRDFQATEPGEKWVSDITYIPTLQGWLYLTIIMDLYDRKIIGWALSRSMTTEATIIPAWKMAIGNRQAQPGLIFHSDRGVQYASHAFRAWISKQSVTQSMSRKGNCWDNAVAENFFKIIKSELVKHTRFNSLLHAKTELFEFIEIWYNRKRKHAYLDYNTPENYIKINHSKCA